MPGCGVYTDGEADTVAGEVFADGGAWIESAPREGMRHDNR